MTPVDLEELAERVESGHKLGIADCVFHRPTGETWLLAYADYETGDLSWLGWPEGRARISDCELVDPATETTRLYWATELERSGTPRAATARRLYPELFAQARAPLDEAAALRAMKEEGR